MIKADPKKGGVLQFGTEVISAADGSVACLLGASPGASTAAPIMLTVIRKCFPEQLPAWENRLKEMIPSFGQKLSENHALCETISKGTTQTLNLEE